MSAKIILLILDGLGIAKDSEFNAFSKSNSKFIKNFFESNPCSLLKTHGSSVGLPEGQMGNSEVGHITIGSGRVIFGDLTKIDNAIQDKSLQKNKNFLEFLQNASKNKKIHICGLLSQGGVHSHENHFHEIIKIFLELDFKVFAHVFLDGRDCGICEGFNSLENLINKFSNNKNFTLASALGRAFGMDRDKRFEKTKISFDIIVNGKNFPQYNQFPEYYYASSNEDFLEILKDFYQKGISDEYIPPIISNSYDGSETDDSIFFINWRADRMIQIVSSLTLPDFNEFNRIDCNNKDFYFKNSCSISEFNSLLSNFCKPIFYKENIENTLGDMIEKNGLTQLRIAETEKYAHVTFFFDGGKKKSHKLKTEILIESPKDVKTYDEKPEMSGDEVKNQIIKNLDNFDVIIANFANLDMIGHTGNFDACVKACEFIDSFVREIDLHIMEKSSDNSEFFLILTSDHGNIEEMFNCKSNEIQTCHSKNPVPFALKSYSNKKFTLSEYGELSDIAPTILDLLRIKTPKEFSGKSLIIKTESTDMDSKITDLLNNQIKKDQHIGSVL